MPTMNIIRTAPVTTALCAVMLVLWPITATQPDIFATLLFYAPHPSIHTALSSAFVHSGASHLAMNVFLLVLLGGEVERYVGAVRYTAIFVTAALGAAACITYLDPNSATVGASGVLYALMVLLIGMNIARKADLRGPIVLVVINVAFSFITPGVSIAGHLGGLIAGVAMLPTVLRGWVWPIIVCAVSATYVLVAL